MRNMFRVALLMTMVILLAVIIEPSAKAEVTSNTVMAINMSVFAPCANGGEGEDIALSGEVHILTTLTINKNVISVKSHYQPQGISGVGLTSGDRYQATGATNDHFSDQIGGGHYEETMVNNYRLIGPGPDNNYLVHEKMHMTINQNGEVTVDVLDMAVDCK